ncbi:MAG TPA: hypothetical protein VF506_14965 [Streptosporangiaceae bacterium]
MRRLILTAALFVLLALAAACSGPDLRRDGPPAVLAVQTGITDGYERNTNEIIDIGLPLLHNLTGHTVRLQSVRWVNQPDAAHIISVYAYRYADVGHGFIGDEGDLPTASPDQYRPSPVTAAVTAPHRDSVWLVVIAFTISKPGLYHFHRAKIRYVVDGQYGWQYQNLDTTYHIADPPLPGPVPFPRSGICG